MRIPPIWRRALAGLAAACAVASVAADSVYPRGATVQLVVAYPAGGGTDTLARLVANELSKSFGASFVVVNRPGASGMIGTASVARAAPDGMTLLLDTGNVSLRPSIEPKTPFSADDFVPVALLTESPVALAVHPEVPVQSVQDLVAYSRGRPGSVNYASTGPGSPQHLVSELMKVRTALDWVQVPYQGGGPALTDLTAGRVQVMFSNPVPLMPFVQARRLKVLAVTSAERLPAMPEVPTMREAGMDDFVVGFWNGVLAPAGTPHEVVARLGQALLEVVNMPHVRAELVRQGSVVKPLGPEAFAGYIRDDQARWRKIAETISYEPVQ